MLLIQGGYGLDHDARMKKLIEIMVPCYNEAESLPLFFKTVSALTGKIEKYDFSFLFIDDGSSDNTLKIIKRIPPQRTKVRYVSLARNFGKEAAMLAGFDYAIGDAVIVMDADLQDPPTIIPELIEAWECGYEDVYAKRISREGESWLKKISSAMYYRILQRLSDIEVLVDVGDFRLLDKKCVEALRNLREHNRYTKGLFCWIGFRKKQILYNRESRVAGSTHWNYWKLTKLAINGIVSFSAVPLQLIALLGGIISLAALGFMLYVVIHTLLCGDPVAGYPSMMAIILFMGGIQLIALGVIGEYIGKIFSEVKDRPVYIVSEQSS